MVGMWVAVLIRGSRLCGWAVLPPIPQSRGWEATDSY
jgi:hypothetical protein